MVIIVTGLPGSGKSYFASRLAEKLEAAYINSDTLRFQMSEKPTYSDREKRVVYSRMLDEMQSHVLANSDVVLDATFYKESLRRVFTDACAKLGVHLHFIKIEADETVIRDRLSMPREVSDADYSVYQKIKSEYEPLDEKCLTLQSTQSNLDQMLNQALMHVHELLSGKYTA